MARTRGNLAELVRQRAVLEHAVAVLAGQAPATFVIAARQVEPGRARRCPLELPSTLLERRPDIAGAERRVAAANAGIGIAVAAYYPNLTLTGSVGQSAATIGSLFSGSSFLWSIGASLAQTMLRRRPDRGAGRRGARDVAAVGRDLSPDGARRAAGRRGPARRRPPARGDGDPAPGGIAGRRPDRALTLNQYLAGQVDFTTVVTVQTTALTARQTLVQAVETQQTTAVALIRSLGGSWATTYPGTPRPG